MQIQIDSREKTRAITKIIAEFDKQSVQYYVSKLYVGDYMSLDNPRLIIDRKQDLGEVYSNLCQDHKRFVSELLRAREAGIKLIILIEHGKEITCLNDVKSWYNPRLQKSPYAWNGDRLYRTMLNVSQKYGITYEFCKKSETGRCLMQLLARDT